MSNIKITERKMALELDISELNDQQIRLIKTIHTMLSHVLTTDDEEEYFDGAAELMQLIANAVKKASFSNQDSKIEYSTQALEFSMDLLAETVQNGRFLKYDN